MESDGVRTNTWDSQNRLVQCVKGGTTTAFQYMGGKVLLEKQGSTTTATYTYGNALVRKDSEVPLYDGTGTSANGHQRQPDGHWHDKLRCLRRHSGQHRKQ